MHSDILNTGMAERQPLTESLTDKKRLAYAPTAINRNKSRLRSLFSRQQGISLFFPSYHNILFLKTGYMIQKS